MVTQLCPACREAYEKDSTHACAFAGTVSEGTLRPEDLILKFSDVARQLDQAGYAKLSLNQPDDLQEYVVELMDFLNERAPLGYYFGPIEGDGACFGFWKNDEKFTS